MGKLRKIKNLWEYRFRRYQIVDPQFDEPGTHGNVIAERPSAK